MIDTSMIVERSHIPLCISRQKFYFETKVEQMFADATRGAGSLNNLTPSQIPFRVLLPLGRASIQETSSAIDRDFCIPDWLG